MQIKQVRLTDKLDNVCAQMQPELWGKDNDIAVFNSADLRKFLENNGVLLLAYEGDRIVGDAMCYIMYYPSGEHHFYVHELDTHPDYRRRGVGEALMREALRVARGLGMTEVWLSTEHDNEAAKALYQKLGPTDVDEGPTYVFDLKR